MRLDAYVASKFPGQSRSTWQKLIERGHVSVNGEIERSVKYMVSESDVVVAEEPAQPTFPDQTIPVLYEDDDVIVIDKPVGLLTHAKGILSDEFTVAEFVKSKTQYKQDTNRPGIIHRLDRATSGVLLCVKNEAAAQYIARQFSSRTVKKTYVAVTSGIPKHEAAVIDVPIGRNPSVPSTFRADASGKPAETTYRILQASDSHALIELRPKTGRTHQLRVHLAHLGTPILGDVVYGKEQADRMYLHAHQLEVTLPGGKRMVFTSAIPNEFSKCIVA